MGDAQIGRALLRVEIGVQGAALILKLDLQAIAFAYLQARRAQLADDLLSREPEEATRLDVPADVTDRLRETLRDFAVRAFEAIEGEGLARVDFFVMPDETVVLNEINTMPGFTPTSMFPRMWAESGLDYPALIDRLLTLARQRPLGLR